MAFGLLGPTKLEFILKYFTIRGPGKQLWYDAGNYYKYLPIASFYWQLSEDVKVKLIRFKTVLLAWGAEPGLTKLVLLYLILVFSIM